MRRKDRRRIKLQAQRASDGSPRQIAFSCEVGPLVAAPGSGSDRVKRFDMVAYTGGLMWIGLFEHPLVVDLDGMNLSAKSRPILRDHNSSMIAGHTEQVSVTKDYHLSVAGLLSGTGDVVGPIVESSQRGFPWQASIGASIEEIELIKEGETVRVNGREFEGPIYVVGRSRLNEISFVALGADDDTSARVAAAERRKEQTVNFSQWLKSCGIDEATLSASSRASLQAAYDAQRNAASSGNASANANGQAPAAQAPATAGGQAQQGADARSVAAAASGNANANASDQQAASGNANASAESRTQQTLANLRAAEVEETARVAAIRRLCSGRYPDIEGQAIAGGWPVDQTELTILRMARPAMTGVRATGGDVPDDAHTIALCRAGGISAATIGRHFSPEAIRAADRPEFRAYSLHSLFAEIRRRAGVHQHFGQMDDEAIAATMRAERILQASGTFSTFSLTGVLGNVANKALLDAFQAVDSVISMIARERDVDDFKEVKSFRISTNAAFEEVGPDGELKSGTLSEQEFANKLKTYGQIISLTRQNIINDDLGAFLELPRQLGQRAAARRERIFFSLLLSNAGSFFHASNGNFISGAGTAFSVDGLTQAERKFFEQKDPDGEPILVRAGTVLVSPKNASLAERIYGSERLITASGGETGERNPHAGKFKVAMSPYLSEAIGLAGADDDRWYLFANPAVLAALEVIYLRGKRTPTIESSDADFSTLGMKWRAFWDFAVAFQDPRGALMAEGD